MKYAIDLTEELSKPDMSGFLGNITDTKSFLLSAITHTYIEPKRGDKLSMFVGDVEVDLRKFIKDWVERCNDKVAETVSEKAIELLEEKVELQEKYVQMSNLIDQFSKRVYKEFEISHDF